MPPGPGQSGPGKKNGALPKQSRNSTPAPAPPSLPPQEFYDPDYLNTRVILFQNLVYDDLVDQGASNATVPDSKSVDAMLDKLKSLVNIMEKRSTFYDLGMRHLADERKKRPDDYEHAEPEGKKTKHKRKKGLESFAPGDATNHGKLVLFPMPIATSDVMAAKAKLSRLGLLDTQSPKGLSRLINRG